MKSNVLASRPCAALLPLDNPPFARAALMKGWRAKKPFPALSWVLYAGLLMSALWCGDAGAQITTIQVLYAFTGPPDGAAPNAGLTLSGSTLYGTTSAGGSSDYGTVFAVPTSGGAPTWLVSFGGGDSQGPVAGLTLSGSTLYGTTAGDDGVTYNGAVFAVPTSGGPLSWSRSFSSANSGYPAAGLTLSGDGNTLYGTTRLGGSAAFPAGNGTVFSVPTDDTADPATLGSFSADGANGTTPAAGLTLIGSTLYGTASHGGSSDNGTVFSAPASGGAPTALVLFTGNSGTYLGTDPESGLTLIGSTLYGTTDGGGIPGDGTVFAVTTGGALTTLASFTDVDSGAHPFGDLALSLDGSTLYGTTSAGGILGYGTVFSVPASGGAVTTLATFTGGANGAYPNAGLTLSGDGKTLYGTTTGEGGVNGDYGTVFSLALLDHFGISAISSPQAAGAPFTITTITAQDADNNTVASFGGTVTFGGTAGVTGTSAAFSSGVLSGASVMPTVPGSGLTVTVDDGSGHTGSAVIATVYEGNPGTIAAGDTTWGPGGNYPWAMDQASSGQGANPGWVWLNITGMLRVTATVGDPFVIQAVSLQPDDSAGPVDDFNPAPPYVTYTWTIATASGGISGFDPSLFTIITTNFENFTGGGTFSVAQSGDGNSVNLVFSPHACDPSETSRDDTTLGGDAQLYFTNQYGLSAVEAINLNNCAISGGTAYGFGFPGGTPIVGSMTLNNTVALPNGTTNVAIIAGRNVAGDAVVNVRVYDECNNGTQFDPVIAKLVAQAGAHLWQTYSGVPSAEHYVALANGTPGLRSVKLLVNGWTYNLGTLADGQAVVVNIGASMNPGASNTILVMASGSQGATANILIADAASGSLVPVKPQVEAPVLSFVQKAGSVVLSWPAPAGFFTLQGRDSLDPAAGWQDLVVNQQESQGWSSVTIPGHAAGQLFRLRK